MSPPIAMDAYGGEGDKTHAEGPQTDRGAIRIVASSCEGHRFGLYVRFSVPGLTWSDTEINSVFRTRHHSYPATHRTIRGYTGAGLMAFTAHVHPKAPQDDKVFLYGVKSGKKWGSGGGAGLFKGLFKGGRAGLVKGGGAVVYHSRSWKKIDMSRLVRGKLVSIRVSSSVHPWSSA